MDKSSNLNIDKPTDENIVKVLMNIDTSPDKNMDTTPVEKKIMPRMRT